MPSGYGQRHVRLPWLLPYLGQVKEGVERGKASDSQKPVRTGTGGGKRLVPTPIGIDPCATSMPICQRCCEATMPATAYRATLEAYDGSPARSWCSGRNGWRDGIVEKARSNGPASTRSSNAIRFPGADRAPPIRRRERNSPVKNRMRETCTSACVSSEGWHVQQEKGLPRQESEAS